jgi:hypothetical protein
MKWLIVLIAFVSTSANSISVHTIPLTTVCFDDGKEAYLFHTNLLKQKLVGLGKKTNSVIAIFHNSIAPSWSVVVTAKAEDDGQLHTCTFFQGYTWTHLKGVESLKKIPL